MGIEVEQSPTSVSAAEARIAELERENARLRGLTKPHGASPRRGSWRAVVSALCIVIASLTVSASIVGTWARVQLVDETQFVATFAPLASDPAVQDLVVDETTAAIDGAVDLEGLTDDLFDGLAELDLPPRAVAALELLRGPAAQGLQGLVDTAVTRLVESDAFVAIWETALRASHRGLVAAATGGTPGGAIAISPDGEIGIQLAPIIEEVKNRLVDSGVGFAAGIPVIDTTIVIATSDALAAVGTVYNLAVAIGFWLPVLSLVLFLVGILVARRRTTALIGTGVGLALGAGALAAGLAIGASVLAIAAARVDLPVAAAHAIYDAVSSDARSTAGVLVLLGIMLAVVAWSQSRYRAARAVRSTVGEANAGLRRTLAARGLDTGRVGSWLHAQRVLVRIVLVVLAVVWLLALRPLTAADVVVVLVVTLLVWWLCELAQRRPDEVDVEAELPSPVA